MTEPPKRRRPSLDRIEALSDPLRRATAAEDAVQSIRADLHRAIRIRRTALRAARDDLGLTRPEIAEQTGIKESTVHGDLR